MSGNRKSALNVFDTLTFLHAPGTVFEIRVPKTISHGTMSGYYDDPAAAAQAVDTIDGRVPAVYTTLNPVSSDIISRCANRLASRAQITTTDREIMRRVWLPLDFDPVRPAGISSTDEEHQLALVKANEVKQWLTEKGWPDPAYGDSGNGAHLLYRINLPNDSAAMLLVQHVIAALSGIFTDSRVSVDETVFNASRIWKVYGTTAKKGDDTDARPHRRALLLSKGDNTVVTEEQLREVADAWKPEPGGMVAAGANKSILDIPEWLERMGVTIVSGPHSLFGGRGQKWIIDKCPFNEAHEKPVVGVVEGRPIYKCLHQSCQDHKWHDFRIKLDPSLLSSSDIVTEIVTRYQQDPESVCETKWIAQLGELNVVQYNAVRDQLKDSGIDRQTLSALNAAVKESRTQRLINAGGHGIPNNLFSLRLDIETLQSNGVIPAVWMDTTSERMWQQYGGEPPQLAELETLAMSGVLEFHQRGRQWVKKSHMIDVLNNMAVANGRNMLKEMYESYIWDRVPRLDTWLSRYMGVEDTEYVRAVGRKWMISMMARASNPGCQVDHMLILEGSQGIGKSKAMRILGGDYHVEYAGSLRNDADHKDMIHVLIGKSIVEISELGAFKGSSIERLKNTLTTTVDDVRLAYRRDSHRFPRTAIFAGTTNEVHGIYINDSTGARRFWPVVCSGIIDVEALRSDREQLMAEAMVAYKSGEDWWEVPESAAVEQMKRATSVEDDFMYQALLNNVTSRDNLTQGFTLIVNEVDKGRPLESTTILINSPAVSLSVWLGDKIMSQRGMQQQVYNLLRRMGFERIQNTHGQARYCWQWNRKLCMIADVRTHIGQFLEAAKKEV